MATAKTALEVSRKLSNAHKTKHKAVCAQDTPQCICNRCRRDNKKCCMSAAHLFEKCPTQNCRDFEPEETEGGKA